MSGFQTSSSSRESEYPTTADVIDQLSRFDGPPEKFLVSLLAVQCQLTAAEGGAILRLNAQRVDVVAVYPPVEPGGTPPVWVAFAGESAPQVVQSGSSVIRPIHETDGMYGQDASEHLVMLPIKSNQGVRGYTAFHVRSRDAMALEHTRERLELTSSLLSLYEMRLTLQRRQGDLNRLRTAMEILAAVNDQAKFKGAAMALCNEVSSRWNCDRVGVGLLKGRYVKLVAMSDTEKFDRKTEPVQKMEQAMEECLDQDLEIVHPAPPEATFVSRSTRELSNRYGPFCIISLPLRHEGDAQGVLLVERPRELPVTGEEAEALRLTADLCTARLLDLHQKDKWFGAKATGALRKGLAVLLGNRHTWIKLLAIGLLAAVLFLTLVKGDYVADGSFDLQAVQRRIVPARSGGYLYRVHVEVGDQVTKGQILAELETAPLENELADARAEKQRYLQSAEVARMEGKEGERQIALTESQRVQVRIDELQRQIREATITAPFEGTIVEGDLERLIGKSLEKGQVLFEIAALNNLHAEVAISDDQIADVEKALAEARRNGEELTGELAATQHPEQHVEFTVQRISPVGQVKEQDNVFMVRVKLSERPAWLKPGMGGSARIAVGKRPYGWIWTRRLINWVRMKLWL
ncbi:MAG: efflux RND transporter periplasmic adaptor subunit [Phycisphaerae bacterium]